MTTLIKLQLLAHTAGRQAGAQPLAPSGPVTAWALPCQDADPHAPAPRSVPPQPPRCRATGTRPQGRRARLPPHRRCCRCRCRCPGRSAAPSRPLPTASWPPPHHAVASVLSVASPLLEMPASQLWQGWPGCSRPSAAPACVLRLASLPGGARAPLVSSRHGTQRRASGGRSVWLRRRRRPLHGCGQPTRSARGNAAL